MDNHSNVLVAAGSLCLTITLVLAWCLAGVRASGFMKRLFPNYQSLLKAHIGAAMTVSAASSEARAALPGM